SEPIWFAADAWASLAQDLRDASEQWANQVGVAEGLFQGEAASKFGAAARQYYIWLSKHAETADETAWYLDIAALAYERAVKSMVPEASVMANRVAAWTMRANNTFFGQFTPRIAELDAEYEKMWATNAEAMNVYQSAILDITEQVVAESEILPPPQVIFSSRFSDVYVSENIIIQ
ncbi:serine-rich protein, partial [Mycobacterium haemophilum DSM 44634]